MKILALRGKNLASIAQEFEIDFRQEPLVSAGIFAITGNTGSGKSTLLDAICLALYDNTPRTRRAESNVSIYDVEDKTISSNDPRNILRKGASEAFAEVDFKAVDNKIYRATWTVSRARKKSSGTLKASEMMLKNLSENALFTGRKTDIKTKIEQLVGLNFDQFTRAVLLAQGDFAAFLKAQQKEKAELLEKLTGTQIYALISAKIYEKNSIAKQKVAHVQTQIDNISLPSKEEIEALKEKKLNLRTQVNELDQKLQETHKQVWWLNEKEKLERGKIEAETELITSKKEYEENQPYFEFLEQVALTQEVREKYIKLKETEKNSEEINEKIPQKEQKKGAIETQIQQVKLHINGYLSEIEKAEQTMQILAPIIEKSIQIDTEISNIQQTLHLQKQEEADLRHRINSLLLQKQQTQSAQIALVNQREKLQQWFTKREYLQNIIPLIPHLASISSEYHELTSKISSFSSANIEKRELIKRLETEIEAVNNELHRLEETISTEVMTLRAQLQDGCPCPVCGSTKHTLQVENNAIPTKNHQEINLLKKQAHQQLSFLQAKLTKLKEDIASTEGTMKAWTPRVEQILFEIKKQLGFIPDVEKRINENTLGEQLKQVEAVWIQKTTQLNNYQKEIEEAQNSMIKIETQIETLEKTSKQQNKNIKDTEQKLQEKREIRLETRYKGEDPQILKKNLLIQLQVSQAKLKDCQVLRETNEKQFAQLHGEILQLRNNLNSLNEQYKQLSNDIVTWLSIHPNIDSKLLDKIIKTDSHELSLIQKRVQTIDKKLLTSQALLLERETRLREHISQTQYQTNWSLEQLHLSLEQETQRKESLLQEINSITIHENEYSKLLKHLQELQQNHQQLLNEATQWSKLNELLGSAKGDKFKEIAQAYTLDTLLLYANKHLSKLSTRYILQRIPDTLALQVVDTDMLNEIRSIHTLSGGESFLLSLALALALSSLSSNKMHIESLFIDEGFGALDNDVLNIAMDALESLQIQGKKIGVISHVGEMVERISTKIHLQKQANGQSIVKIIH